MCKITILRTPILMDNFIGKENKRPYHDVEYRFKIMFKVFGGTTTGLDRGIANHDQESCFQGIVFNNVALNIIGMSPRDFLIYSTRFLLNDYGFDLSSFVYDHSLGQLVETLEILSHSNSLRRIFTDLEMLSSLANSPFPKAVLDKLLLSQLCRVTLKKGKMKQDLIINSLSVLFSDIPESESFHDGNTGLKLYLKREIQQVFPRIDFLKKRKFVDLQ
jgi:hypothetical protein